MTAQPSSPDPFSLTANPDLYVRRPETDRALATLERAILDPPGCTVLVGPAGIGKTLLLRVLARRLADRAAVVHLPYPALPPAALCRWALQLADLPANDDPERGLVEHATRRSDPLVLLIDDVDAMPGATLRRLGELLEQSGGSLRLGMACFDQAEPNWRSAFGVPCERVVLEAPLSAEETARYVRTRLEGSEAPAELRDRFDDATLRWLQRESGGIPSRIHEYATSVLRGGSPAVAPPEPAAEEAPAPAQVAVQRPAVEPPAPRHEPSRDDLSPPPRPTPSGLPWGLVLLSMAVGALLALGLSRSGLRLEALWSPLARAREAGAVGEPGPRPSPTAVPQELPLAVNLNAQPWAEIEIDGLVVGLTPLAGIPLQRGPHQFRAHMPDGRIVERTVHVGPETRHVVFE